MNPRQALTTCDLVRTIEQLNDLPTRTVARLRCLFLRAHIEELVDQIPNELVSGTYSGQIPGRAWCLVGAPDLTVETRIARERVVRGVIAAYKETSDVLHGRRISLAPDPLELDRWRAQVAAACELVRAEDASCDFCGTAGSDFR